MTEKCSLFLDRDIYYPGQTVTGRLECFFKTQKKVNGIYVVIRGRAKTWWRENNHSYWGEEEYFNTRIDLVQGSAGDIIISPGNHVSIFSFELPSNAPSTFKRLDGSIKYCVKAIVDLPWQIDWRDKKKFTVGSILDLNDFESLKSPVSKTEEKEITSLLCDDKSISVTVRLPITGLVPLQDLTFNASVNNMSSIDVSEVRFKIVQIFEYTAINKNKRKEELKLVNPFVIPGSEVASGFTKFWDLEVIIPAEACVPNLTYCNIIKTFCELRGTVVLPFPHRKLKIKIPLSLGTVPIKYHVPGTSSKSSDDKLKTST